MRPYFPRAQLAAAALVRVYSTPSPLRGSRAHPGPGWRPRSCPSSRLFRRRSSAGGSSSSSSWRAAPMSVCFASLAAVSGARPASMAASRRFSTHIVYVRRAGAGEGGDVVYLRLVHGDGLAAGGEYGERPAPRPPRTRLRPPRRRKRRSPRRGQGSALRAPRARPGRPPRPPWSGCRP